MNEFNNTRAQMLGQLIQQARTYARHTVEECAQVLGTTAVAFTAIEAGEQATSLPELEALAIYLNVPMGYFWGKEKLVDVRPHADYGRFLALRHRVIGVLLQQLRLQTKQSALDVARAVQMDVATLQAYELGQEPIPYLHLEALSKYFEVPVDHFVDGNRGPLGRHEAEQRLQKLFHELSPETQAFMVNPSNVGFLETARRLSNMDVQNLRRIAESILDITY